MTCVMWCVTCETKEGVKFFKILAPLALTQRLGIDSVLKILNKRITQWINWWTLNPPVQPLIKKNLEGSLIKLLFDRLFVCYVDDSSDGTLAFADFKVIPPFSRKDTDDKDNTDDTGDTDSTDTTDNTDNTDRTSKSNFFCLVRIYLH